MRKIYYDEAKKELRGKVINGNVLISMIELISVCNLTAGLEHLMDKNIAMAVTCFVMSLITLVLVGFMIRDLNKQIEEKIEYLGDMHDIDKTYMKLENELLENRIKELENTSDSEEQEDGDTKEHECELEESSKMS